MDTCRIRTDLGLGFPSLYLSAMCTWRVYIFRHRICAMSCA